MSTEDLSDQGSELFTQDGVLLKSCLNRPVSEFNTSGTLCLVKYAEDVIVVEWRPSDVITIDSETNDQEWAVVDTIGRRSRTFSGNCTQSDIQARARTIKLPLKDIKGFRVTRNNQQIQFSDKGGQSHSTFFFQHGNAEVFVQQLKIFLKTANTSRDRTLYVVIEQNEEAQKMSHSFAELDIFQENRPYVIWNMLSNLKQSPYTTAMEAFSKVSNVLDIAFYGNETVNGKRDVGEEVAELLSRSMSEMDEATTTTKQDEYEVITVKASLPPRINIPRGTPLTADQWEGLQDTSGRIDEVEGVKQIIFRGGVSLSIRPIVWKYLLDYYPWRMTHAERASLQKKKNTEYFSMKLQWRSITEDQESRFAEYRERKSLVEKDVNRTDRSIPFYAGDNNPNLEVLSDILMTYVMYNFDLGYVQGMSDILSPILALLGNEVDSFWCFVGFMNKIVSNFDIDLAGMKNQLQQLNQLLTFTSPELAQHLALKGSGNMYFCFRWMLVWFKREFSQIDIMRLWEVLWTGLPCHNFHLLICVAILDKEKDIMINNDYGFTEILKHVNDLSMRLNVDSILSQAEGIYHQITSAAHLTDQIRVIIGLPTLEVSTNSCSEPDIDVPSTSNGIKESTPPGKNDSNKGILMEPDSEEVLYQIGLDMNF